MATLATHPPVHLRALLTLAGPVVASRLGIMAMGLVDTLVVGRHSAVELGYLALAWAPTGVVLTTAIGLLQGVQVLTSQALGAGRAAATGAILRRGLVYAFWVGCAAALVLGGLGGPLLAHIGLDRALAGGATPVLRVLALSLPPIMLADAGIFWLEAHGRAVRGTVAMWGANVVNLGLNLWLVPGHSGFAVAGAEASAWSTALSRTALLLFTAVAIVVWRRAPGLGVYARPPHEPGAARALRRIGYAASISYAVESSAFSAMTVIAGWLGAAAVASWAIVLNLMALVFMVPLGLATATAVLVGRAYGARDARGVRRAGLLGFAATLAVTLAVSLGVGLGAGPLAAAYTHDVGVQRTTAAALVLAAWLFFTSDGLQVVAAQSLRARGDIWVPTATHTLSYVVVLVPAGYAAAISLGLGVAGIVWGTIVASAVSAGLLLTRFLWLSRSPTPSGVSRETRL